MLTRITFNNFTSFKEETQIDFSATKYTILQNTNVNEHKVLKGAMLLGPNAAGKTNVLKGLKFLISTLKEDHVNYSQYCCLFSPLLRMRVEYVFRFGDSTVIYDIGYDHKKERITEQLTLDSRVIMERAGQEGTLYLSDQPIVDSQLDKETTFLRTAAFNTGRFPQHPALRAMVNYILNSKYIEGSQISALLGHNVEEYLKNEGADKYNKYLEDFNYDFYTEYTNRSRGEGATMNFGDEKRVVVKRKDFSFPMPFKMESQGNQVFMDILACILPTIEKPGMIIIDEFGNSLHNGLAERLVHYFMGKANNSQVFITSHCTNLISNSVFRPDQLYRVTFEGKDGSRIKRISDFQPREAQNLEKMYLGGMFEGLPNYGENI